MKKGTYLLCSFIVLCSVNLVGSLTDLKKVIIPTVDTKFLLTDVESKEASLAFLQQEHTDLEANREKLSKVVNKEINNIRSQIDLVQDELSKKESEFLSKKLGLLNQLYHDLKTLQSLRERQVELISKQIKLLELYLQDHNFTDFKNSWSKVGGASFDDLRRLHTAIIDKKKVADSLTEKEKIAMTDLDHRRRAAAATVEAYKKIKSQREVRSQNSSLTPEQQRELWDIEEKLFENKKRLDMLRIKESEYSIELYKNQQFINDRELKILAVVLRDQKTKVCIGASEVSQAKERLEEKRKESYAIKRKYDQEIDKLDEEQKLKQKELSSFAEQAEVVVGPSLDQWSYEPIQNVEGYEQLVQVGFLNTAVRLLKNQKQELKAHLVDEDEKIGYDEIVVEVQETFHKICARKFVTDEELVQEAKTYSRYAANIKASLSSYASRLKELDSLMSSRKVALAHIEELRNDIEEQKDTLFKIKKKQYDHTLTLLKKAEDNIKKEIDVLGRIRSVYNDAMGRLDNISKLVEFILADLGATTMWYRPEHAVSWEGVKNIGSDLKRFFYDIRSYITTFSVASLLIGMRDFVSTPFTIIALLLLLGLLFLIFLYLPGVEQSLLQAGEYHTSLRIPILFCAVIIGFIRRNFIMIALGFLIAFCAYFALVSGSYGYALLYLLAIPFFIYLAHKCIYYFLKFNESHDYPFLGKEFQRRFAVVFPFLIYATIAILFLRQAFLLGNYQSDLPTILLAINFIILQISLISLVTKDQILSLIPEGTEFWNDIRSLVDRYYYLIFLFVITVIVLSNPYVGFGQLVLYVLRRFFYSIGLILLLVWLHQIVSKIASNLFFSKDYDVVKERFAHSKTWYGVSVITLFAIFTFLGAILVAKIWGWPEWLSDIDGWSDISVLLKEPLRAEQRVGVYEGVSIWNLITIVLYILGGIVAAYAFGNFVLGKIFDIFHVNAGIQNTITSIAHYIIFLTATILGFNAANLGGLVLALLGVLALSIGFVIKDPILDFVAYFIILVQRPIKVGDYVKIDDKVSGVVRKINPRSVVLRQKNSTSIVVPNSMIISKPIINWNYSRGFIAFNDISVRVAHGSDPLKARELMYKLLAENPSVLKNPRPIVRLDDIGPEGYRFTVRGYLSSRNTLDQWDIAADVRIAILKEFAQNNIKLAVPVRMIRGAKDNLSPIIEDMGQLPDDQPAEPKTK